MHLRFGVRFLMSYVARVAQVIGILWIPIKFIRWDGCLELDSAADDWGSSEGRVTCNPNRRFRHMREFHFGVGTHLPRDSSIEFPFFIFLLIDDQRKETTGARAITNVSQ